MLRVLRRRTLADRRSDGLPWSPRDYATLKDGIADGRSAREIANELGRTEAAVRRRAYVLGLPGFLARSPGEWGLLRASLTWRYGAERTQRIFACKDEATNADIAAWRALGRR
jgi:hypothetical protein